jgi:CDP-glucose 4,6-dehydratase
MENLVKFENLSETFRNKKVLITGDTGFKGSWLSMLCLHLGAEVYGYALDPVREQDNYVLTGLHKHIHHQTGDIRDFSSFSGYIRKVNPDIAFHLAAQPLVLESYRTPVSTFETNVMGVVNFLEAIRGCSATRAAVVITTDKCYKNNEWIYGYREIDPLGGNDPYSASKACAELVSHAYTKSFFENTNCAVATARAGNVIGGGDWAEDRIVPDFFRAVLNSEKMQIRNPDSIRPWQFVLEPLWGYIRLSYQLFIQSHLFSGAWNFGPNADSVQTVEQLVNSLRNTINQGDISINNNASIKPEAAILRLDISKSISQLGWRPLYNFEETVQQTCIGYFDEINQKNIFQSRMEQIKSYLKLVE